MQNRHRSLFVAAALLALFSLLAAGACGRSNGRLAPDPASVAQSAAATLTAQAGGQMAPEQPAAPAPGGGATILAEVDTNCRAGAGKDFEKLGYLASNESAPVLGQDPSGNWWLITNPRNPSQTCWVWTETTQLTGDAAAVPVSSGGEPPPAGGGQPPSAPQPGAPEPSFTAQFTTIQICETKPQALFAIQNTGSEWLRSLDSRLLGQPGNTFVGRTIMNRPGLMAPQGCPPGVTDIKPGSQGFIAAAMDRDSSQPNQVVDAELTFCSQPDQAGQCTTQVVRFTIPQALPPPPAPPSQPQVMAVAAMFAAFRECNGKSSAGFQVINNGTLDVKSVEATLQLQGNSETQFGYVVLRDKPFSTADSCQATQILKAGDKAYLTIEMTGNNLPVGQKLNLVLTVCSAANFGGQCEDYSVPWEIPVAGP